MPYVGESLTTLFDVPQRQRTSRMLMEIAQVAGDKMHDETARNTPIETGNLRTSWYQLPTTRSRGPLGSGFSSGVATDVSYAPYVEYGTGLWGPKHAKYPITSKSGGMLRFMINGHWVYARKVMHPGSPGQHMLAIAAAVVESELEVIAAPAITKWQREVEAGVH